MEDLEGLWRDEHEEGVPFRSNTDVHAVSEIVFRLLNENKLDPDMKARILQWIRWHWFVNSNKSDAPQLLRQLQVLIFRVRQ